MLRHILPGRIADGKEGGKEADQHKQKLCQHYTAALPEIGFLLVNIALVNTYDDIESAVQDRCIYNCPLFSCPLEEASIHPVMALISLTLAFETDSLFLSAKLFQKLSSVRKSLS